MAANTKFGEIETVVRRDLVKDDDSTQYRWSSFQVLAAINRAFRDVQTLNEWAAYDQETCERIAPINVRDIAKYCESNPKELSETTSFVVGGQTMTTEQYLAFVRDTVIPLDDQWHDAVAYFAAFHVLETAGDDAEYRRRAAEFYELGKGNALK